MTQSMLRILLLCALVSGTILPAAAQTPTDFFTRGNEFYRAGQYDRAAAEYENILKRGYVSAEVYFNLGNAYYRENRLGLAILAYERAARLAPGDADIRHNLRLLSLKTVDRIEPVPELFLVQWIRSVAALTTPATALVVFLGGWGILFLSLAALYLVARPAIVRTVRWTALAGLLVGAVGGCLVGLQRLQDTSRDEAIVTASVVTAKSSPDEHSVDAFVIHEGLKVNSTDAVGDWVKITLPDGKVGWVRAEECQRI